MSGNDFTGPIVIDTNRPTNASQKPATSLIGDFLTGFLGVIGVIAVFAWLSLSQESALRPETTVPDSPTKTQAELLEEARQLAIQTVSEAMNREKQKVFNSMHPVGEAKKVVVHDLQFSTGEGGEPIALIRYTVNWEGPLTTDGYTKSLVVYDLESQRVTRNQILSTNGMTNEQAGELFLDVAKAVMDEAVRQSQMNAERQYRGY